MIFLRVLNAVIFIFLLSLVAAWICDYYKKYEYVFFEEHLVLSIGVFSLITAAFGSLSLYDLIYKGVCTGWFIAFLVSAPIALICYLLWRKFTKNY